MVLRTSLVLLDDEIEVMKGLPTFVADEPSNEGCQRLC
jgi:hypothetical protein